MVQTTLVTFAAAATGSWRIDAISPVLGKALAPAARLAVLEGPAMPPPADAAWALRGAIGNTRYTMRAEVNALSATQEGLGRPLASRAALIPIRKTAAWWALAQDERRQIFEETSHHIRIGLDYLPAVARRLHHSRELGEPFDFLTWFEFAPADAAAFDAMLGRLRQTEEWRYVEREVEVRLSRD